MYVFQLFYWSEVADNLFEWNFEMIKWLEKKYEQKQKKRLLLAHELFDSCFIFWSDGIVTKNPVI
jgi:hypothetical protein